MPDKRKHRGPHPKDPELFSGQCLDRLRLATSELSWLLSHDYALASALKLVGDRHGLVARQRMAVRRAAASDKAVAARAKRLLALESTGSTLLVDGLNIIVTVEAAIAGGLLLRCRDTAIRDLSSVHGSYRKVEETAIAVDAIARTLDAIGPLSVQWLLDSPVSNSGRLAALLRAYAAESGRDWQVDLVHNPDMQLTKSGMPVATSDSNVLDNVSAWVNLTDRVVSQLGLQPWIVDMV